MFVVYEVEETEEKSKLDFNQEFLKDYLHPEKVFIIVKEDLKRIYLWKGVNAPVRKRFIASRCATDIQAQLKEDGFSHCKIVSVDQGNEIEEFLNIFNLESIDIEEEIEDMRYLTNREKQKLEEAKLFSKEDIVPKSTKLDEIREKLDDHEKILWVKSFTLQLDKNWSKKYLKNKDYKTRLKDIDIAAEIKPKNYEVRYVITNKKIAINSILNRIFNYTTFSENTFRLEGDIAILNIEGIKFLEVEEIDNNYNVSFNLDSKKDGNSKIVFENLNVEEYEKLIEIFTIIAHFRAEIPKNYKLKYIQRS